MNVNVNAVDRKVDGAAMMALVRPALAPLIGRPQSSAEVQDVVWWAVAVALEHPQSAYRSVERGHIYAYPRQGEPEQYVVWQQGRWHWQDVPDGPLQRLRVRANP